MKCPRCGNEMKIKKVFAGEDRYGEPVHKKYAYCYQCKIKQRLDAPEQNRPRRTSSEASDRKVSQKRSAPKSSRTAGASRSTRASAPNSRRHKRSKAPLFLLLLIAAAALFAGGFYFLKTKAPKIGLQRKKNNTVVLQNKDGELTETKKVTTALSREQYDKITYGMSVDEVTALLGSEGTLLSETTGENSSTAVYTWYGEDSKSVLTVTFHDSKMQEKFQTGLK